MKQSLIFFLFILSFSFFGQNRFLQDHEDTLIQLLEKVHFEKEFKKALVFNQDFELHLRKVLRDDQSFNFPFDSLSTMMSTKKSPDGVFRLFNWNIEMDNQQQLYMCLIMKYDEKKEEFITIELFDKSESAVDPEYTQYTDRNWYGSLYYEIIPINKGNGTSYTLLGWDGNNIYSNKKIIETMTFQSRDKIKFGTIMFHYPDGKTKRRVILQYNKQSYMSLKHRKIKKVSYIIFDHLVPTSPLLKDMQDWYVTDLSFDAFKMEDNKWNFLTNIKPRSLNLDKDRPYNDPIKRK